jgi:hypothetical protein
MFSLSFIYALILKLEFTDPIYRPNFDKNDLDENGQMLRIPCKITTEQGVVVDAQISNWGDESIYLKLSEKKKLRGRVVININSKNNSVAQAGEIYTESNNGLGYGVLLLDMKINNVKVLPWGDFYARINDLGL